MTSNLNINLIQQNLKGMTIISGLMEFFIYIFLLKYCDYSHRRMCNNKQYSIINWNNFIFILIQKYRNTYKPKYIGYVFWKGKKRQTSEKRRKMHVFK